MGRTVQSFLVGVVIIAILYVLSNPNSQGPALITAVAGAFTGLIGAATGNAPAAAPAAKKTAKKG